MTIKVLLDKRMERKAEKLGLEYLSYRQVSRAIHISPTTLSLLNKGKANIRLKTLEKLCRYLECTPGDLLKLEKP